VSSAAGPHARESVALALPAIEATAAAAPHPIVVGISGYGGSGKSTLARALVAALPDAVRMRGDDFLDPERSHHRSPDWDGVERDRLRDTVLRPFREGRPSTFQRFDWSRGVIGDPEPVPAAQVMIVDLVGLFHPSVLDDLDVTVWCDIDLETAGERGMARDRSLGRDHDHLWREVWMPNDCDFDVAFAPRSRAMLVVPTS